MLPISKFVWQWPSQVNRLGSKAGQHPGMTGERYQWRRLGRKSFSLEAATRSPAWGATVAASPQPCRRRNQSQESGAQLFFRMSGWIFQAFPALSCRSTRVWCQHSAKRSLGRHWQDQLLDQFQGRMRHSPVSPSSQLVERFANFSSYMDKEEFFATRARAILAPLSTAHLFGRPSDLNQ